VKQFFVYDFYGQIGVIPYWEGHKIYEKDLSFGKDGSKKPKYVVDLPNPSSLSAIYIHFEGDSTFAGLSFKDKKGAIVLSIPT